jgi:hypothetical protein
MRRGVWRLQRACAAEETLGPACGFVNPELVSCQIILLEIILGYCTLDDPLPPI